MFGIGPAYLFFVRHRVPPVGLMRGGLWSWIKHHANQRHPSAFSSSTLHQIEDTFWAEVPAWNLHNAALHGSSHYELPRICRRFTANIGVHQVHRLCARIPFYRLQRVLREHPELKAWAG